MLGKMSGNVFGLNTTYQRPSLEKDEGYIYLYVVALKPQKDMSTGMSGTFKTMYIAHSL